MVVRLTIAPGTLPRGEDDTLFELLAGIPSSWSKERDGGVTIWVEPRDADEARAALSAGGLAAEAGEEPDRDWVAAAAALQRPVAVGPYLLDPHEDGGAPGARRRLFIPAVRAFGTGSHESTRLALRLLLREELRGRRVLDVGCGTGVLAFVAALEGAAPAIAFDVDADAVFAARELRVRNAVPRVAIYAGPLEALAAGVRADVVVANMIAEELAPLLSALRGRMAAGARLVTSGQLLANESRWLATLRDHGFRPERLASEGEWLGTASSAA